MKVLILGSTGMAGHLITLYFKEHGHDVTAYSVTPFPFTQNVVGNAFDLEQLKLLLITGKFDLVINCIGLLNREADDNPDKSIFLNSYLPHFLVDVLKESRSKVIQMSTDCVFAGNTGPYFEDSLPDGRTIYDRTKALGEINDKKNLTFRNSIIGPDMNPDGIGLFNWFMKQENEIKGYTKAMWTGVTTLTLAKAMEKAANEDLKGIYNLVNNSSISKYDLLMLFNRYFKNNSIAISPFNGFVLDKSLRCSRTDFSFKVPDYEQQVEEMKEWIMSHKKLYPHYF
ncbi:MAG: sugar nucleotide-binding protein [Bacteroidales bacterium]